MKIIIWLLLSLSTLLAGNTVTYFYSHGLADTHKQVFNYMRSPAHPEKPYLLDWPTITFDYPDATTSFMRVNRFHTSLAQENEVFHLARVYYHFLTNRQPTVLMGVSRGAAALLPFMGMYHPPAVQALILESPFDAIESIVCEFMGRSCLSWIPGIHHAGHALVRLCFCKYRPEGFRPLDFVRLISPKLPVLIICFAKDPLVPVWASINVYKAFREHGNNDTYILILPSGKHGKLILDPVQGKIYQDVVHAFYQKYHLPYNTEAAARGKSLLEKCQPSFESLTSYYPSYASHYTNSNLSKKSNTRESS